jgi:hypothetical protein
MVGKFEFLDSIVLLVIGKHVEFLKNILINIC